MVSNLLETTPGAIPTLPDLSDNDGNFAPHLRAEAIKLFLPSGLPSDSRKGRLVEALLEREIKLRIAQADDALSKIFIISKKFIF